MRIRTAALATAILAGTVGAAAHAQVPELPVLHPELQRGTLLVSPAEPRPVTPKVVDGRIDDWVGESPRLAGTIVRSDGELIYTDHLGDAHGADDGSDAERLALLDPMAEAIPETYRLDPVFQSDVLGQIGFPTPDALKADEHYGSAGHQSAADILEVRVATGPVVSPSRQGPEAAPDPVADVHLLVRTLTMTHAEQTAALVLADTREGTGPVEVAFGAGLTSDAADLAILLAGHRGWVADLVTGTVTELPAGHVATDPGGYTNAIEARLPRDLVARPDGTVRLAVATGLFDAATEALAPLAGVGANVANVAFRTDEPVRTWMDKHQALALGEGTIDPFLLTVALADLDAGATDAVAPVRDTTSGSSPPVRTSPRSTVSRGSTSTTASTSRRATTARPSCPASGGCTGGAARPTPPPPSPRGSCGTWARPAAAS
jgi:hypothetical protein